MFFFSSFLFFPLFFFLVLTNPLPVLFYPSFGSIRYTLLIGSDTLGKEDFLAEVAKATGTLIQVLFSFHICSFIFCS